MIDVTYVILLLLVVSTVGFLVGAFYLNRFYLKLIELKYTTEIEKEEVRYKQLLERFNLEVGRNTSEIIKLRDVIEKSNVKSREILEDSNDLKKYFNQYEDQSPTKKLNNDHSYLNLPVTCNRNTTPVAPFTLQVSENEQATISTTSFTPVEIKEVEQPKEQVTIKSETVKVVKKEEVETKPEQAFKPITTPIANTMSIKKSESKPELKDDKGRVVISASDILSKVRK